MIVCMCKHVSDKVIRREIEAGARDLRSLVERTTAGSDCGACVCDLQALLQQAEDTSQSPARRTLPLAAK